MTTTNPRSWGVMARTGSWLVKALLTALALALVGWCVRLAITHQLFREDGPIDDWQTLITGALAIAAALIGGYFVNAQVRLAKRQEDERLRRRHAATRATMPLTLSALMEYARLCGRSLRLLSLSTTANTVRAAQFQNFEPPPVPGDKITALAEIIEAGRPDVGRAIAQLLHKLQVQDGRLRSTKSDVLDPHSHTRGILKVALDDFIIDAADLYARCEGMLDYAREDSEVVGGEPATADLKRALLLMGFHEAAFDRVKATIDRRAAAADAAART